MHSLLYTVFLPSFEITWSPVLLEVDEDTRLNHSPDTKLQKR